MKKKQQLVKSISGVRGVVGNGLDPLLVTAYGAAFGSMLGKGKVIIGRDTRPSGPMISAAVIAGMNSVGIDVIDLGVVPTPTVEIAITESGAAGGICVTASHNPSPWNALKFFADSGEFITAKQYQKLDGIFNSGKFNFQPSEKIGRLTTAEGWVAKHIALVLKQKVINPRLIRKRKFKVVVDAINGAGFFALPELLEKLGAKVVRINCKSDGDFVHQPEPTQANLKQLSLAVKKHKADLGMACDPDADRLALVDHTGLAIGEELTLALAVYHVLKKMRGPTVINLSTSSVTADVARMTGSKVYRSKVGEANVAAMMHSKKAVIGGEGNGGVMLPGFHAGRDALVGAAIVLACLAEEKLSLAELVIRFPKYHEAKFKAELPDDFKQRLVRFENDADKYLGRHKIDRRDGLRFDFEGGWLLIRSSNTEPIYRLVVETNNKRLTRDISNSLRKFFK